MHLSVQQFRKGYRYRPTRKKRSYSIPYTIVIALFNGFTGTRNRICHRLNKAMVTYGKRQNTGNNSTDRPREIKYYTYTLQSTSLSKHRANEMLLTSVFYSYRCDKPTIHEMTPSAVAKCQFCSLIHM